MAQSLTSKASLPIIRSNRGVSIFAQEGIMNTARKAAAHKSVAETKHEPEAVATAPVVAPTKPAKQPKPAKVAPAPVVETKPAEPEISPLERVIAKQAKVQGRNVRRVLGRALARIAAGQSAEEAVDAILAQVREAVLAAIAAGATAGSDDEAE